MLTGFCKMHLWVALVGLFAFTFANCSVASAQDFSVGFGNREFTVNPGDTFSGSLTVSNRSASQAEFAATLREFKQPDKEAEPNGKERSLCDYLTFSPAQLVLGAGESGDIHYQVTLPNDLTLEGSYWGAIAVNKVSTEEEIIAQTENADDEQRLGVGITLKWEYQIGIYATIEGTEKREATFSAIKAEITKNCPAIVATFDNLGNIHLRPEIWMEVNDVTGQTVYRSEPFKGLYFPGKEKDIVISLAPTNLTPGEYMVMVIADYGVPQMIAAQARVTVSEEMADAMAAAKAAAEAQAVEDAAFEAEANGDGDGASEGEGEPEAE